MWVRQCGATKGRLCPNHTEAELYGEQSTSTKVHNDILIKHISFFCHFVPLQVCETAIIIYKNPKSDLLIIALLLTHYRPIILFILFLRGLITCGQCLCYPSRTSPIISVSPWRWVNFPCRVFVVFLSFLSDLLWYWNWLMIVISTCISSTEWSELCHWRRNFIKLGLPFSHTKKLCVRRKTMNPSAFTIPNTSPLYAFVMEGFVSFLYIIFK